MYSNSTAQFRPELHTVLEEALAADSKFIADLISPVYPVKTRTGDYLRIKRGKGQALVNFSGDGSKDPLARAPGTAYKEATRTSEKASWSVVDRGITTAVDDVLAQDAARFYDMEAADSRWLLRSIRTYRESRVANFIYNESRWGKIDALTAFTKANLATFDAPELIKEAKAQIDKRQEDCDTLVLSRNLWDLIQQSAKMLTYCFGSLQGNSMVTREVVAAKFELRQILVGNASYDTTKPGKDSVDNNLVWCWGDDYMWLGSVRDGAPENGGAMRTFVLEDLTNGGQLYVPESWRDENIRSDKLRVRQDCEENVVNELAGLLVKVNSLS